MSDDIIIVGATQEEHDIRLEKVVQKLDEHGLTLNATKQRDVTQQIPLLKVSNEVNFPTPPIPPMESSHEII